VTLREIPQGGLCLSAFLVLRDYDNRFLIGKIDAEAPWDYLGALDRRRIEEHRNGWMLPSSHLIVHESPKDAALRIAREQLDLDELVLSEPKVISEVYPPKYFPDLDEHWDIEFIFSSVIPREKIPSRTKAFREIKMLDPRTTKRSEIARSHEDVLASAGIVLPPEISE
jgi:hypothetical protein